jgi:transposase
MKQQTEGTFLGIDVSKSALDLAQWGQKEVTRFENDATGIAAMVKALSSEAAVTLIVVEASGGFEQTMVTELAAASLPIVSRIGVLGFD